MHIKEVDPWSSKHLDNKVPKKYIFGACGNSLKATDYLYVLKKTRIGNINNVIMGNPNINSLPKKFDDLKALVTEMLDILIITETKSDNTVPVSQFHIDGYSKPYRFDRNRNGVDIIIYVREDIPNRMLTKHNFPDNIEGLFIELNFRKSKWLLGRMYHPPSQPNQYFFTFLNKALDVYSNYEHFLLIGDFNTQIGETHLDTFLYQHELANINKEPTYYNNSENPGCIDFFCPIDQEIFFKRILFLQDCQIFIS